MLAPALISGGVFGFLAGAPFVGLINCACCALIVATGFVAAALYARDGRRYGAGFDVMDGLKVALLAALFYAVAETLTSTLSGLLFHEATTKWLLDALQQVEDVPPELLEQIEAGVERGLVPSILFGLLLNLGFGVVFSSIGGVIGGAAFRRGPDRADAGPTV
jgi:hypothetical protein